MPPAGSEAGIVPFGLLNFVNQLCLAQLADPDQSHSRSSLANFLHVHRRYLPAPGMTTIGIVL
jgi:hypothetical protein